MNFDALVRAAWESFVNTKYETDRLRIELSEAEAVEAKAYRNLKIIMGEHLRLLKPGQEQAETDVIK